MDGKQATDERQEEARRALSRLSFEQLQELDKKLAEDARQRKRSEKRAARAGRLVKSVDGRALYLIASDGSFQRTDGHRTRKKRQIDEPKDSRSTKQAKRDHARLRKLGKKTGT